MYFLFLCVLCSGADVCRNYHDGLYWCSRNPTPEITPLLDVTWHPVEKNKSNYLNIDTTLAMYEHYEQERMALWDYVYRTTDETKSKLWYHCQYLFQLYVGINGGFLIGTILYASHVNMRVIKLANPYFLLKQIAILQC